MTKELKAKKIIFLDIDGVLQPVWKQDRFKHDLFDLQRQLAKKYQDDTYLTLDRYDQGAVYYDWNMEAVNYLKSILSKTGANIVISSDWRNGRTLQELKCLFRVYNLDQYVIDVTPIIEWRRTEEIVAYLQQHSDIDQFVILDDAFLKELTEKFPDNFVYCRDCLREDEYKKVLSILNKTVH